jgi:type VI secretion system protein ImpL
MPIFLKHIEGSKADQIEPFDKEQVRIGRHSDNDVKFDPQKDVSVSGYHAEIYRDGENYFIKDLQSRNGTFVNSRKIDQPVALKDGDTVQFSARGPKIIFLAKDPSAAPEAETNVTPENAPTQIFMPEAVPAPEAASEIKSTLWQKLSYYVPVFSASAILLVLLGVGLFFFKIPWWKLLIGTAVILLLVGGGYVAWRWWKRRKQLAEQEESAHQQREISLGRGDKDNLQDIKKKWADVLRSLKDSKLQRSGDDPIYAFPWYLFIGESGSGKSSLIKSAGPLSSVVTPGGEGPTRNCDWWFFEKTVVLDLSGRYVFQSKESDAAGEWRALLGLLKTEKRREPLNGVIVTLPADSLISKPLDKLREQAALLRERLDEINQSLGIKFPVYLVINKSDLIVGFHEFLLTFPEQVKGQALGYVNSDLVVNSDPSRFFDRAFRTICARTERLRLATLNDAVELEPTRGMFLFPAELKSLQVPLKAFVDILLRPSPYRDAPFFRGLFFTSARQGGLPTSRVSRALGMNYSPPALEGPTRSLFVRDFFSSILPADRVLVGHTAVSRERSQLTRAAGVTAALAGSLIFCGLLTLSFTNNWRALSRLNVETCTQIGGSRALFAEILRPFDECRDSIESVTPSTFWQKFAFDMGLGFSSSVGSVLRNRYVFEFRDKVLNVIDDRIEKNLAGENADALVVSLIIQRLERLGRCEQDGKCIARDGTNEMNYRTMLAVVQSDVKEGDPAVERLQRVNESYLVWQDDPKIIKEMYARDLERIRNWSQRGRLTEEWVLESTRAQFAPIRASDLWGVNVASAQVDAAYTAQAWKSGISPLVAGLQKMAADRDFGAALQKFHENYRSRALSQWENFLSKLPEAENSLSTAALTREFGAKILAPEASPYYRAIDLANANLSITLDGAWKANNVPSWAMQVRQYVALKSKIQQGGKQPSQESDQIPDERAVKYVTMYLEAVGELRSDLSAPDKCFKSAQKAFQEGEVSSKASQPLLKATWALGALKDVIGARQGDDAIFWTLLERPLVLAWRAMLAETGRQLQEQWYRLRLGVKNQQDSGIVGERIYGFATDGPAAPFLQQGGRWAPRLLLKERVQFTDAFLQYLSRLRVDAITNPAGLPPAASLEPPAYIVRTN